MADLSNITTIANDAQKNLDYKRENGAITQEQYDATMAAARAVGSAADPIGLIENVSKQYVIYGDPEKGLLRKIPQSDLVALGVSKPREIRPAYTNRNPNERPMTVEMVDSDFQTCGILVGTTIISALKLTPNPQEMTISSAKIINRYFTMARWVEEYWGDEMDSISLTGGTFSFFAYDPTLSPAVGLTTKYQNSTHPYMWLRALSKLFRSNGLIYQDNVTYAAVRTGAMNGQLNATILFLNDPDNEWFRSHHPRTGLPVERVYLKLSYDYVTLYGYFENFDIIEDSQNPYRMTYNAVFKSEKTVWLQGNLGVLSGVI